MKFFCPVPNNSLRKFIFHQWLLILSIFGLVATSIYTRHIPHLSTKEYEVLFLLYVLFIAIKGMENSGLIRYVAIYFETGNFIPLKLIIATFLLSMFVTNDISLMVMVPITILLNIDKKDIIIILEALAANAGSALTPIGNPQNLYIYWFYNIKPIDFFSTILPFTIIFLVFLILISIFIDKKISVINNKIKIKVKNIAYFYVTIFIVLILCVLHLLPIQFGLIVVLFALIFDRDSLKIDYVLLIVFWCFFGVAENIKYIIVDYIKHPNHIFILSATISQLMSNVPAALVLAKFTKQWKALLWGTNVGGFGNIIGSLANLIAYRLYLSTNIRNFAQVRDFTLKFLFLGYIAFFLGIGLYFCLYRVL